MKKLVLILISLLTVLFATAQNKRRTISSVNFDLLAPVSDAIKNNYIVGGGASLQIEVRDNKKISYVASSGYSVLLPKPGYGAIIQLPTMIGAKYRINDVVGMQLMGGIVVLNNGLGSKFAYTPGFYFDYGKLTTNVRYSCTWVNGGDQDITTVGLGISYKL
jgi:hypothetical protein